MSYFAALPPIYDEADPPNSVPLLARSTGREAAADRRRVGTGQVSPMNPPQGTTVMRRAARSAGGEGAVAIQCDIRTAIDSCVRSSLLTPPNSPSNHLA
jgi:hypothetical protein